MYCWGSNSCGELGLGDFNNRVEITPISYLAEKNVINFCCGESHVIVLGQNIQSEALLFEKTQKNKFQKEKEIKTQNNNARFGEMRKNNKSASNLLNQIDIDLSAISDNQIEKSLSNKEFKFKQNSLKTSGISDICSLKKEMEMVKSGNLKSSRRLDKKFEENSNPVEQKFYQNYFEASKKNEDEVKCEICFYLVFLRKIIRMNI